MTGCYLCAWSCDWSQLLVGVVHGWVSELTLKLARSLNASCIIKQPCMYTLSEDILDLLSRELSPIVTKAIWKDDNSEKCDPLDLLLASRCKAMTVNGSDLAWEWYGLAAI